MPTLSGRPTRAEKREANREKFQNDPNHLSGAEWVARRWARPGAHEEHSKFMKAYWAAKKAS